MGRLGLSDVACSRTAGGVRDPAEVAKAGDIEGEVVSGGGVASAGLGGDGAGREGRAGRLLGAGGRDGDLGASDPAAPGRSLTRAAGSGGGSLRGRALAFPFMEAPEGCTD
ncbi:MAG TPA: hypothetical protein VER33_03860, partial [Polyangiaceae bacterium]|nr:hypothetical protein [Polyangiaceae bacterium]